MEQITLHNGAYPKTHLHKSQKMAHVVPRFTQIVVMCHLCTKKHKSQIAFGIPVAIVTPLAEMSCPNFFLWCPLLLFLCSQIKFSLHDAVQCRDDALCNCYPPGDMQ